MLSANISMHCIVQYYELFSELYFPKFIQAQMFPSGTQKKGKIELNGDLSSG